MSAVHHPDHYGGENNPFEAIKVIDAWGLDKSFCLGNVLKYLARAGRKPGVTDVEDLEKAAWYLNHEIELRKGTRSLEIAETLAIEMASTEPAPREETFEVTERLKKQYARPVSSLAVPDHVKAERRTQLAAKTKAEEFEAEAEANGWITATVAARKLGITVSGLSAALSKGKIACVKRGGPGSRPAMYDPAEVDRYDKARLEYKAAAAAKIKPFQIQKRVVPIAASKPAVEIPQELGSELVNSDESHPTPSAPVHPDWLISTEAAALVGVSAAVFSSAIRLKKVQSKKSGDGKAILVRRQDALAWAEARNKLIDEPKPPHPASSPKNPSPSPEKPVAAPSAATPVKPAETAPDETLDKEAQRFREDGQRLERALAKGRFDYADRGRYELWKRPLSGGGTDYMAVTVGAKPFEEWRLFLRVERDPRGHGWAERPVTHTGMEQAIPRPVSTLNGTGALDGVIALGRGRE